MELYCYSAEGVCLGLIEDYTSFRWVKKFGQVGSFRLTCSPGYRELLAEGAILWPSGDDQAGFVRSSVVSVRQGKEILEVAGETLAGLLGRRIVWKDITFTGTEEALMRRIVDENAIRPTDPKRVLPRLALGPECGAAVAVADYAAPHEDLVKALTTRSAASSLGYKILFDPGGAGMTFVVYTGVDRSSAQAARSPVVFADEYDNIITAEYRESDTDYANAALVEGEKRDDGSPERVSAGDASGLERREAYIAANGVKRRQDDGRTLNSVQYRAALVKHGQDKLSGMTRTQAADATVKAVEGNLAYGEDWALGDIVTLELRRQGVRAHLRVAQVDESWERGKHYVTVTFGEDACTQLERIERRIG